MKTIFTYLSLLILSFGLLGARDTGVVKGLIQDSDGEPLPFATVILNNVADSSMVKAAYSDESGEFILTPVPAGEFWLKVTFTGMETYESAPFTLSAGQTLELPLINLAEQSSELETVNIRAKKPLVQVEPDKTVFNVSENPIGIGTDAFELLKKAPGVIVDNSDAITLMGKNGVLVFIDGKRSYLSTADLANLLKTIQSNEVESIEIITNPSSKYDAEGNAGVINIKMKKDLSLGANGSVNLGYAIGKFNKFNGSVSGNYRNKKINTFGSYSAGAGRRYNWMEFWRVQGDTTGQLSSYALRTNMYNNYQNHNLRGGVDYFIDGKHTIGILASGVLSTRDGSNLSQTDIALYPQGDPVSLMISNGNSEADNANYNLNVNYAFDGGEGSTWNIDADYGYFKNSNDSYIPNDFQNPLTGETQFEDNFFNFADTKIDIYTFKVDHERNLLKGKLGAGVKFAYVTTDNQLSFYNEINDQPVYVPERSNLFTYTENVNAGYVNYKKQIKKWGLQAGLRVEQTNSLAELTAEQNNDFPRVERNYLNWFPSAGATYNLNQKNMLRLTYSRRIDRPRYQALNPFLYQLTSLAYRAGNPFIQPQYTHNVEITHTFKYTLNTSLSYSHTQDFFSEVTLPLTGGANFLTTANLDFQQVITLNVGYPFSVTDWWSFYVNGTVYNKRQKGRFQEGDTILAQFGDILQSTTFDFNQTVGSFYGQTTVTLPKNIQIQASGYYNTPGIWGANFLTREFWGTEAGILWRFLDEKASLKLAVSDPFLSQVWRANQVLEEGNFSSDGMGGYESRQFRVNFTYNFGSSTVKSSRKRKTGLDDEKDRANGG